MTQTCRPAGAWENWFADVLYTYRPAGATEEQYVSVPIRETVWTPIECTGAGSANLLGEATSPLR